jgi:NitT/TauT family transport system substrate-binding protein
MAIVGALALVGLALAVAGGTPATAEVVSLRVGSQVGSELDYAPYWIAIEKGYFKQEGIEIIPKRAYANGPMTILDFNKGDLDAVLAGLGPYIQAAAQGSEFVMVMSITKNNAPIVARPEIKAARDLNGKKVGTPGLATIQDTMLLLYEKEHGIKIQHVYGKITDLIAMLEKGEIQAFCGWETVAAEAVLRVKGAHYLAPIPVIPGAESLEVAVSPRLARQQGDVTLGFVRAILKGMRYYEGHEDEALRIIARVIGTPQALEVVRLGRGQVKMTDPYLEMKSSKVIFDAAAEARKIPLDKLGSLDAFTQRYLDYSFLKKAEESLRGWQPTR